MKQSLSSQELTTGDSAVDETIASAVQTNGGMILGFIAVICFAFTLPLTRYVTHFIDPWFLGLGRTVAAAPVAFIFLCLGRADWPSKRQWFEICLSATGVTLVFPLCIALAMSLTEASRGGVVFGLLPLTTAVIASFITKEKMPTLFWLAAFIGALLLLAFSYLGQVNINLGDNTHWSDALLILAVLFGGLGYALGGKLSKEMPGWQVICWTVVVAAPFLLIPTIYFLPQKEVTMPVSGWLSLAYLVLISQLLGFFLWNKGLALGGIARVSQIQLLQPFFTLMIAAILFGESLTWVTVVFAVVIAVVVFSAKYLSTR